MPLIDAHSSSTAGGGGGDRWLQKSMSMAGELSRLGKNDTHWGFVIINTCHGLD